MVLRDAPKLRLSVEDFRKYLLGGEIEIDARFVAKMAVAAANDASNSPTTSIKKTRLTIKKLACKRRPACSACQRVRAFRPNG